MTTLQSYVGECLATASTGNASEVLTKMELFLLGYEQGGTFDSRHVVMWVAALLGVEGNLGLASYAWYHGNGEFPPMDWRSLQGPLAMKACYSFQQILVSYALSKEALLKNRIAVTGESETNSSLRKSFGADSLPLLRRCRFNKVWEAETRRRVASAALHNSTQAPVSLLHVIQSFSENPGRWNANGSVDQTLCVIEGFFAGSPVLSLPGFSQWMQQQDPRCDTESDWKKMLKNLATSSAAADSTIQGAPSLLEVVKIYASSDGCSLSEKTILKGRGPY